jgi:hypothetical protein
MRKVFLAGKVMLHCTSNIAIYGAVLDIDNYWLKQEYEVE